MTNPWKSYVEDHMPRPVLRKVRSAQDRARRKALAERDQLYHFWVKHHRKLMEELCNGPYGEAANNLIGFLHGLTPDNGEDLFEIVCLGPWREADDDVKYHILKIIDARIASVREHYGMPPFDSSLPEIGEEPTLFERIRDHINAQGYPRSAREEYRTPARRSQQNRRRK